MAKILFETIKVATKQISTHYKEVFLPLFVSIGCFPFFRKKDRKSMMILAVKNMSIWQSGERRKGGRVG